MKPILLPIACIIPPLLGYSYHKKIDEREIEASEVSRSQTMLGNLLQTVPEEKCFQCEKGSMVTVHESQERGGDPINHHHLHNLIRSGGGVSLLPRLLNDNQLKNWKNNLYNAIDSNEGKCYIRNNRGRIHSHQESRKDPYHNHFVELVSSLPEIQNVVNSYFQHHSINRYQLTQIQFLLAKPGSKHQIWHRDNIAPGLTLLIALDDVDGNGPTEILLGSHLTDYSVFSNVDETILGCLNAGDAILYDARIIHRGRGYSQGLDRPVLILRWDSSSTLPPGAGLIVTNFINWLGSFKTVMSNLGSLIWYKPSK